MPSMMAAISRMVSLGSVLAIGCGSPLLVVTGYLMDGLSWPQVIFTVVFAILVEIVIVVKHKDNIKRIAAGTERKLGQKS